MADLTISPCDDTRRALVKRLAVRYPGLHWVVSPFITAEMADHLSPEEIAVLMGEILHETTDEVLWSLPAVPLAPDYDQLYCISDWLNVRTVTSTADPKTVVRQLRDGDAIQVLKRRIVVGSITWAELVGEHLYAAEKDDSSGKIYLSPQAPVIR